jgi:thiol:disulfide interchange protein DsbC
MFALQACAQEAADGAAAEAQEAPPAAAAEAESAPSNLPEEYAHLANVVPGVTITEVSPTPIEGLVQATVGSEVFYLSADGKYFVQAEIVDLATRVNLTEQARSAARVAFFAEFSEDTAVTFAAENEEYKVVVFTDIDCPYCRQLHRQIPEYNKLGITIEYAFFPRSGPETPSWEKADAVWCSDSRQDAMTAAKSGEVLQLPEGCEDTPVASHYETGRTIGVSGTPAIFTESGMLLVGYRSPEDLKKFLDEEAGDGS